MTFRMQRRRAVSLCVLLARTMAAIFVSSQAAPLCALLRRGRLGAGRALELRAGARLRVRAVVQTQRPQELHLATTTWEWVRASGIV